MLSLILWEIRRRVGTIVGWAIGLGAFCAAHQLIYTALPDEVRRIDVRALTLLESLGMQTFATFEGFMLSTALNLLPLLTGALGVALGVGALAAEESDGTLEWLASLPISRTRLLLGKAIAAAFVLLAIVALAGLITAGAFLALSPETPVTAADLFLVILVNWLIGFVFLAISLFLGAYLPTRGAATSTSATALLVSFLGNNLAGMAPAMEPYRTLLPHFYFDRITGMWTGEVGWLDMGTLAAIGLGALLLAFSAFTRRSLTVAAWPWQRPRPPKRLRTIAATAGGTSSGPRALASTIVALLGLALLAAPVAAYRELAPVVPTPPPTLPSAPTATPLSPTATSAPTTEPTAVIPPTSTPTLTSSPPPTATATITPAPTATPVTYTVQPGDTLAEIAQAQGVTLEALIEANNIEEPSRIEVGDVFIIPLPPAE